MLFECEACRDTGFVFSPRYELAAFSEQEIVECESEVCIKRRAIEVLDAGRERKIFKGGEMKLTMAIKGFEISEDWESKLPDGVKQAILAAAGVVRGK